MKDIIYLGDKSIELEKFSYSLAEEIDSKPNVNDLFQSLGKLNGNIILVVGSEISMSDALVVAERVRLNYPEIKIILSRKRIDVDILSKALRAGIAEVVTADDSAGFVQSTRHIREIFSHSQSKGNNERINNTDKGKVIIVFSAKGGCGKTTLSINLASALSNFPNRRVCLVDLDLQFGDVAVSLQANPEKTISSSIGMGVNLDLLGTRSMITNQSSSLDLLLAPTNPTDVEFITGDTIGKVLENLKSDYDYVVIDTPPAFTDFVLKSFELMDACFLLTTLEMPAIKNLKIVYETLDALKIDQSAIKLVINRADLKTGISTKEAEELLQRKIDYELSNDLNVAVAANQGQPLIGFSPKSRLAQAINNIASDLEKYLYPESPKGSSPRSLFRRKKK